MGERCRRSERRSSQCSPQYPQISHKSSLHFVAIITFGCKWTLPHSIHLEKTSERPRTSSDVLGRPRTASDGLGRPRQLDVNHRGAPSLCRTIAVTNLATTATKTAQIVSANVTFVAFVETVPYLLHQICRNRPIQRRMRCDQGSLQCGQPMRCPTP
jgi:hypothetical protein